MFKPNQLPGMSRSGMSNQLRRYMTSFGIGWNPTLRKAELQTKQLMRAGEGNSTAGTGVFGKMARGSRRIKHL